jgi:tryptophan synthase alpha subunit
MESKSDAFTYTGSDGKATDHQCQVRRKQVFGVVVGSTFVKMLTNLARERTI